MSARAPDDSSGKGAVETGGTSGVDVDGADGTSGADADGAGGTSGVDADGTSGADAEGAGGTGHLGPASSALWDGRYRVLRTLGAGGMGRVLLAEDLLQGERLVALKRFVPDGGHDVAAFLREFRIHRQLAHPNIPRAYELGFASGDEPLGGVAAHASGRGEDGHAARSALLPYFTMEVASGVPITSIAERFEGRIPLRVIAAIATGLLRALDHLHRQGWLHGDLKPANVLVDQAAPRGAGSAAGTVANADGWSERVGVHLIDFGVALSRGKAIGEEVTATPEYAAPEVLEGGVVDARSDLYAVGLLLFEMLENRRPWPESDIDRLWAKRKDHGPPALTATSCPPALASLVRRLLASDPAERPATASIVLEELSRATGWTEVIEPPEAFVQRLLTVPLPWRGWLEALAVRVTEDPLPPGEPWAVIVRIPAGFFARRLLGPVLDEAAARRARILPLRFEARGEEESARAWAPVREVLSGLDPARGVGDSRGAERPFVLVVEGLATRDPDGLKALAQALGLGGPQRHGVRLVATLNAGAELSDELVALLGAPAGVAIVDLPGWDGASMRAWLHRALGRIGAPWETEPEAAAGGAESSEPALPMTPAGVIEALAAYERQGHLVRSGEGYAWREVGVGPRDHAALVPGRRVEPLDALIACIKSAVPEAAIPPYLGAWVAELPELVGTGVLKARGDGTLEVGDEPRRATLYGQLGVAQRRAVHRRLAQALEEALAPAHRVAEEWLDSDAPLLAVPHLLAAAEARPGRAWLARAMGLVGRARELVEAHGAEARVEDLELWRYEALILRTEVRVLLACGELGRLDSLVRRIAELGAETGHRHTIQVALELRMALDLRRRDWDRLVEDAAGLVALGGPATTSASFLRPRLAQAVGYVPVEPAAGRLGRAVVAERGASDEVSPVARARLHWARALRFRAEGLPTAALTELEAGLGVFSGLETQADRASALAIGSSRTASKLGPARDDIEARIVLLEARAELCLEVGWSELAAEAIDQLSDVARRTGRAASRIKAQLLACERWREEGRVDRALALARESASGLPRERTPELDAAVELELGGCRFELGELELAMDHARFARALADDEGAATTSARAAILMARVAAELGRREEAWRCASEAAARVGASDPVSAWARLVVLEVALGLRGFAAADEVLRAASELGFRAQRRLEGAKASAAFSLAAEAALTRRLHAMAVELAGRGVDAAREGARRLLPRALWVLGRALLVTGKRPDAEARLAEARAALLVVADGFDDAELRERWLAHPERRAILGVDSRPR